MNFGLVLADTSRSNQYLNEIIKNKFRPEIVYVYSINEKTNLINKIKLNGLSYKFFKKNNINDNLIVNFLLRDKLKTFIYSGYPAEIVGKKILKKKNFIHIHPGLLPKYKGSTTIYYSLILEKKIFCTCLKLNNKIDEGKILFIKRFSKPNKLIEIENKFDNYIRSKTLISFLQNGSKKIRFSKKKYSPYYIAHPLVRSLVFKKKFD